jgi:hypothetical protein
LSIVIHHHMEVTMDLSAPMLRCGRVVSTGLPYIMTPSYLFDAAADVGGAENINTRDAMPLTLNL